MVDIQQQANTIYSKKVKFVKETTSDTHRESLLKAIDGVEEEVSDDELILKVLDAISDIRNTSEEKALKYVSHAFQLAREVNFIEGIVYAGTIMGDMYWHQGDFKLSLEYLHLALQYNYTLKDKDYEALINKGIGNSYLKIGFLKEALKHYTDALGVYEVLENENERGTIYNNIGVVHKEKGEYEKALSYYLKSLNIKKNTEDYRALANVYLNVGILYDIQKEHKNALKYLEKILEIPEEKLDKTIMANIHSSIGQVYLELEDNKNALKHIYKGLNISKMAGNKAGMALSYQEIGRILEVKEEYGAAAVNYEQALKISREIGSLSNEADSLFRLGKVNYQIQKYDIAEEQLKESFRICDQLKKKPELIDISELLSQLYYKRGKFRESCDYMKQVYKLQEEFSNEEKTKILAEMQTRFELQQRDMTISKLNVKQEMLLKANQELELFAGKAAHDLKEPLRMMSSFSSLLSRKYSNQLDETGQEFITHIHEGAKRMEVLLTDMLTFAKSGADPRDSVPVNLNDILYIVKTNLKLKITEKEAIIECDELPTVRAASTAMIQLFQNITANALKFSKPGIAPKIHIKSVTCDDNFYQISIQDNGIGIPTEQCEKVFIIFQRIHKRDDYEGSGIGLATCKKIVECLGGKIWIESEEGEGATFHFLLPKV